MANNIYGILEGLDSQQKQAVLCKDGPVLIVAGAGSGKTRVLTSRIAYTIENGCEPDRILALTFTKKAAAEMKERIALMVGERKARRLYMGTFHSVFIRFLREFSDRIGYPPSFTIYDTSDSQSAIKTCLKEMKLDDKVYKPKDVLSRISNAKNSLVTPQAYAMNANAKRNDAISKKPEICNIYSLYQKKLREAGVMDFDDILLNMNILIRDNADVLASIAGRFSYILVDEYQDTNFAQYLILKKLSQYNPAGPNICVVGDDSQSIYAFRGATIQNILNFQKEYPGCHIFRLEQNYRSTQTVVNAANSLIAKNAGRIPKTCFSKGDEGDKIRIIKAYTEQEEALLIASSIISKMQEDHAQYQDFAILYRTNSQSRALEEALRKRNLPYIIYSGNSFFERAEVKDMMAYLKLVVNPNDDESFKRVVNKPARGIGETSVQALTAAAAASGCSLMKAAYLDNLESVGLRPAAVAKIRLFTDMIVKAHSRVETEDAHILATSVSDSCGLYASFKSDNSIESQSRASNIEELMNSVRSFIEEQQNEFKEDLMAEGKVMDVSEVPDSDLPVITLGVYLENISLLSSVDVEDEDTNNRIALMTVHFAKGLEFPYVYVSGMEENLFPSGGMLAQPNDIEEERRLFYVALTRAKKSVDLSLAQTRMRNGQHASNPPSRFIKEIDKQYIKNPLHDEDFDSEDTGAGFHGFGSKFVAAPHNGYGSSSRYGASSVPQYQKKPSMTARPSKPTTIPSRPNLKPVSTVAPDKDFIPVSVLELKAGQHIEHNRFGLGTILEISGPKDALKAKISFKNYGEKVILLNYAKIRIIE